MDKFSLTSIHCSQQFNYTADDNFLDKFSLSARTDEQVLQCAKFFFDKCTCSKDASCFLYGDRWGANTHSLR